MKDASISLVYVSPKLPIPPIALVSVYDESVVIDIYRFV